MPAHKIHRYFSRLLLGKPYGEVHRAIDLPYRIFGRNHRKWFHSPLEAATMGTVSSSNAGGGMAGLMHVWLDRKCSKDKEFKKCIEFMERMEAYRRRQIRLQRKQIRMWNKLMKKSR